jgi:hypothetical protein
LINLSEKKIDIASLKKEINEKKQMVSLHYVDEEVAQEIENDLDENSEKLKQSFSTPSRFIGYNPTIIDFIRRCDTEDQAEEIITFLEQKGEIDNSEAKKFREQLTKKGLRSFGSKKKEGYYYNPDD